MRLVATTAAFSCTGLLGCGLLVGNDRYQPASGESSSGDASAGSTAVLEDADTADPGSDDVVEPGPESTSTGSNSGSDDTAGPLEWWDSQWRFRRRVEFEATMDDQVADFTFRVDIVGDEESGLFKEDGSDIRFIRGDGEMLPYELEGWGLEGSPTIAWVRVPLLGGDDATEVTMYYGNPSASAPASEAVFSDSHVGVWHLDDRGDSSIKDNQVNPGSGRFGPSTISYGLPVATGGIPISIPTNGFAPEASGSGLTISAWVFIEDSPTDTAVLYSRAASPDEPGFTVTVNVESQNLEVERFGAGGTQPYTATFENVVTIGEWQYIVVRFDPMTGARLHVNEESYDALTEGSLPIASPVTAETPVAFGGFSFMPHATFQGIFDEVRVSNVQRSARWIRYHYVSSQGLLATMPNQEEFPG
ncbi:MAG: DUF2341 domain-containing protein [Myxococcota bacterium]